MALGNGRSRLNPILDHIHGVGKVYPRGALGVSVAKAGGAWTAGVWVEIIPAGIVPAQFDIHGITVGAVGNDGEYEISLSSGAGGAEVEITCEPLVRIAAQDVTRKLATMTPLLPAGTRICAKLNGSTAALAAGTVKLSYHTY